VSDVLGSDDAEVASVECREFRFPQTFDACQDSRIDEPQRKIAVLRDQGSGARELPWIGNVNLNAASINVGHQAGEPAVPGSQLIFDLHQSADRDDPDFCRGVDQLPTAVVIGVAAVNERDQRAGV